MPTNDDFEAKRKSRQREIKRKRRKVNTIIFLLICFIGLIVMCFTVFFKVKTVKISGSELYDSNQIVEISDVKGKNLFTISREKTENKLRLSLPYIDSISFKRKLPNTLYIEVKDAVPFSYYESKGKYYIASPNDYILEETKTPLPELLEIKCSDVSCTVGKKVTVISKREQTAIETIKKLVEDNSLELNSIDVSNPISLKIVVSNRFEVNLGTKDHLDGKINHLKAMLSSMDSNVKGEINLSLWTPENREAPLKKK